MWLKCGCVASIFDLTINLPIINGDFAEVVFRLWQQPILTPERSDNNDNDTGIDGNNDNACRLCYRISGETVSGTHMLARNNYAGVTHLAKKENCECRSLSTPFTTD
ncbi:hypothetical protein MTR_0366s0010 [Medicago truncatula]|uniref:Uncharacterized protein n=1 Tax=Medicago truncatula TaxID=3880 RepID=G7IMH0_MEDTR|nr:hypothetical protein MTR_0366s0010 [Medicago truncatula]